jgi:murein DD-endopeptidase MepM/ murein hydrolase activator NlpD
MKVSFWKMLIIGSMVLLSENAKAGIQFSMSTKNNADGSVAIIANNKLNFCPVTIVLEADLNNMSAPVALPYTLVIPANTDSIALLIAPINTKSKWGYKYRYKFVVGDCLTSFHTDTATYAIPFMSKTCIPVAQGYYGDFSHQNKKALDFTMPEGTSILCAREGVVIDTKYDSNSGCAEERCVNDGNYIKVLHHDGSIATYVHLKYNGVLVKPGQKVYRQMPIGLSGSTGWAKGPHLHFEVGLPTLNTGMPLSQSTYFVVSGQKKLLNKDDCVN